MGSKSKSASSKRAPALNEPQDHAAPSSKRSKKLQYEAPSSISLSDPDEGIAKAKSSGKDVDMDVDIGTDRVQDAVQEEHDEDDDSDVDMQDNDRESSGESDVEDDEDKELKATAAATPKMAAHTSDRVQKVMTNPEIEAAFHNEYMTQITQAFGDELNTLREALNSQLEEWLGTDYATHQYHLNLLYSVYSFPNVVLPLLGGLLIDRLSASRMLILFSLCVFVGQGIFAIGVTVKSIWVMVLGRFVFGVGSGCLEVAQAKITTDWFKARWLGLALGLNLSFARIATAMNDILSPRIAVRGGGVIAASWTGFAICALSLFCSGFLAHLDRPESRRSAGVRVDAGDRKNDQIRSRKDNIVGRAAIGVSSDSTMTMSSLALEEEDDLERDNEMAEDGQMVCSKTFTLEARFWILCLCCISLYGAVVPFIHISSDFLQKKWYPDNPTKAGAIMSIPDIVSSVGSPLCGYIVDRLGHRARYIPVAALLLIWAHVQLGFTHITPIMAMCILGLAYSLFASVIWPCIPFLVQDHQLGTAYGLVIIALNISLTVFPMIVASILYATHGSYSHIERLFVGLAVIGLILSILLNVLDQRRGRHSQLIEDSSPVDQRHNEADDDYLDIEESFGHDRQRDRLNQQCYHGSLGHDDPRQPGFEHRRQCRFPEQTLLLQDEDFDMQEVQDMVTTKSVGEGIVTIIPHTLMALSSSVEGNTPLSVVNKTPVDVTLFVMSRCPDAVKCEAVFSKVFETENLPPVNPLLSYIGTIDRTTTIDTVTLTATTTTSVTCKHGPLECAGNTQQLCFKKYFPDPKVWVPFVVTMNSWVPNRIGEPEYAREVAEEIVGEGDSDVLDQVNACGKGREGFALLVASIQHTIDHGVGTSCTVYIDNKKRCVVDGGVWRECPEGSSVEDFVRTITEAASRFFSRFRGSRVFRRSATA
ncbi:hypothetical protein BGZ98_005684 [Dissophora globulifera]|nr:hypothetical protein BGZ98_005684 [Dissophora globulifera]